MLNRPRPRRSGHRARHLLAIATAAAVAAAASVPAQARTEWSVGLDIAVPLLVGAVALSLPHGAVSVHVGGARYWRHGSVWYRPWGPRWVVVAPPVMIAAPAVVETAPRPEPPPPAAPAPSRPEPVVYPRNGQDAQQTEADRQACDRWATTQPAALAEASVFLRAVEACMDGRGYTLK